MEAEITPNPKESKKKKKKKRHPRCYSMLKTLHRDPPILMVVVKINGNSKKKNICILSSEVNKKVVQGSWAKRHSKLIDTVHRAETQAVLFSFFFSMGGSNSSLTHQVLFSFFIRTAILNHRLVFIYVKQRGQECNHTGVRKASRQHIPYWSATLY